MKVIFGLGNPGPAFGKNRHNFGFMVLDRAAELWQREFDILECQALTSAVRQFSEEALLAKPLTFMNTSGRSAALLLERYDLVPRDLIVIYDDIDLLLGTIRLRRGGGAGFHRGVISIIEKLGTEEFPRLRLGILGSKGYDDLSDYVLSDFDADEMDVVEETLYRSVKAMETILTDGLEAAMRTLNVRTQRLK
ncbi:MAG: aminoacyl-tRNA hydrolase [Acidobacteriota bacterium]